MKNQWIDMSYKLILGSLAKNVQKEINNGTNVLGM